MSYKTYRMWQAIMGMAMGAVTAACVALGLWIAPIPVLFAGLIIIIILRRRVKEIVSDERTYSIAEKAARMTFQVATIGLAFVGIILLSLSHVEESNGLTQAGFALEYAACALMIINTLAYNYYSRKLGGTN
jgi:uncharacterized membrane protein